jgi:uncharacterized protein (TIGR00730 family)
MKKENGAILAHQDEFFINSPEGRDIRVLAEFMAPANRFKAHKIKNTLVFFGSARTLSVEDCAQKLALAQKSGNEKEIRRLTGLQKVAKSYDNARELAKRLSVWSESQPESYSICTGGGPGIMEAGNRGAHDVCATNVGLNIELPFEQYPNPYITPELSLNFNYFFVRKYWFLYMAKALVAFPGGYGTLDELFETLTLIQTKKILKPIPIVLFDEDFWKKLVNLEYLAETSMIDPEDLKLIKYCNTVDEAFDYITESLIANREYFKNLRESHSKAQLLFER